MGNTNPDIIGYDAISALGSDLEQQWQDALAGKSGIGPLSRFPLKDDFPVRISGQCPDIDDISKSKKYPFLTARHQASWSSPIFKYGMLTVARALERSGLEITPELAPRVAVTYSSAVGGLDRYSKKKLLAGASSIENLVKPCKAPLEPTPSTVPDIS